MFYIILIAVILLFPIPLKIKLVFTDKKFKLFIYKKEINISNKNKFNKGLNNFKKDIKQKNNYIKFSKKIFSDFNINNLFKPILKINFKIILGFSDAAHTAMIYGLTNIVPGFIYNILAKFCKIKKFKFNVEPIFNNEILYAEIYSIFFVNLVKVIYIVSKFLILSIKEKKLTHSKIQRSGTVG